MDIYFDRNNRPIPNRSLDTPSEIAYLRSRGFNVDENNYLYDVFNDVYTVINNQLIQDNVSSAEAHWEALRQAHLAVDRYERVTQTPLELPANHIPNHESFGERPIPFANLTDDDAPQAQPATVEENETPPPMFDLTDAPAGVNRVSDFDTDDDDSDVTDSDMEGLGLVGAGHIQSHNVRPFFAMN
tara:strand:- start:100 stop:657 length:558 start_codon:yes stop_codon:yes gene_type:complete